MPHYIGIDIGSSFTKVVIQERRQVVAWDVIPSGGNYRGASAKAVENALHKAGIQLKDIFGVVSTGYGGTSSALPNRAFTDISCISRGISQIFPRVRTVVDIGGQYSRVIKLDESGRNTNFLLSERCAGGSGRFLQIIAHVTGVNLEEIGAVSLTATAPVNFSTGCAVFAETEAISRIAEGAKVEDILAGAHNALASMVQTLVERIGGEKDIAITGGGAHDAGLIAAISKALGVEVLVPREPQITAAFGASLFAEDIRIK